MRGSDFNNGILAAIILGTLYASGSTMDDTSRRRRRSNAIGLVVLVGFVIAMVCYGTYRAAQNAAQREEAQKLVNSLAYDISQNNSEPVMKWAKGEVVDPWENQVILVESSRDGVQVASKGVDGQLHTEDDVVSEVYVPPRKIISKPPEKKKGMMSKLKSFFTGD